MATSKRNNGVDSPVSRAVIANMRIWREHRQMSQPELAAKIGVYPTAISSIERGQRIVSVDEAFLIADALGVDLGTLMKPVEKCSYCGGTGLKSAT